MHVSAVSGSDDSLRDRLLALAAETRPLRPLPGAGELLWSAEIRRALAARQHEEARVCRPALWGQAAGVIVGAATILLFAGLQIAGPLGLGGAASPDLSVPALVALFSAAPVAALLVVGGTRRVAER